MGKTIEDLGTPALTWWDLSVVTRWSDPHKSALYRAMDPEGSLWDLDAQLSASAVDLLSRLWWVKTKNAGRASNRMPKPIPRPGFEAVADKTSMRSGDVMTTEEFDRRYAARLAATAAQN